MCNMTYSYLSHDSFICVTWLIHTSDMTQDLCIAFICVTRLIHVCVIHMCDMTHSCLWHDSFICVTWLIHVCDMTHSCVWHDSFICVTRLIHIFHMTISQTWDDTFIYATRCVAACVLQRVCCSVCVAASQTWDDTFIDATRPIHMRHESVIYATWLTEMCDSLQRLKCTRNTLSTLQRVNVWLIETSEKSGHDNVLVWCLCVMHRCDASW